MGFLHQLMTFLRAIRRHEKPADLDALNTRLDEVERQLDDRRRARLERLDAQTHLPHPKGR